jgi:hypothetical protein
MFRVETSIDLDLLSPYYLSEGLSFSYTQEKARLFKSEEDARAELGAWLKSRSLWKAEDFTIVEI